jgi:hypothetical protein
LIEYLEKASGPNQKDSDYYYFLVANGYYNMSINGISWMMRRFGVSENDVAPFPEDEDEFRESKQAKKYYYLAYSNAKDPKFAALCLRLWENYLKLEAEYPDYSSHLASGCGYFGEYFNNRK